MAKKAFLCHSWADKDYVRRISGQLMRSRVVFDEVSFQPGSDFRDASKHLDKTGVFVFIASRSSLDSS